MSWRLLDDLDVQLAEDAPQRRLKLRSLIASIGVEFEKERMEAEQGRHKEDAAKTYSGSE